MRVALVLAAAMAWMTGCAAELREFYGHPFPLSAPPQTLALPVRLDLDSLRAGELPGYGGDPERRRAVGEGLARNAERIARAAFGDVSLDAAGGDRPRLRPRVVVFEIERNSFAGASPVATMLFEWSLLDRDGAPLWIETVGHTDDDLTVVVERTLQASLATLVESPELRAYGAHGVPAPPSPAP